MERSTGSDYAPTPSSNASRSEPTRKEHKRFGLMSALVRLALALAIVGFVAYEVSGWVAERPDAPRRMNRERTFTVEASEAQFGTFNAPITAYGQVAAGRTIDLRALVQGRVIETSNALAAGREVEEGETLVQIDPFAYDGAVVEARAAVANAELSLTEAREAYTLEEQGIAAAEDALASARTDLERARSLLASGAATQQTVDTRALTVSEREQALQQRRSNLVTLNAEILRQQAAIEQARYAVQTAMRDRDNTTITAPFNGVVTAANVTTGGYVSANEVVASLYESSALDVSFMVSDRDYTLLRREGLFGRDISVSRAGEASAAAIAGQISRVAPEVDAATGGVTLYGTLAVEDAELLRPGTFVAVEITGVEYENALLVPETAIYDGNHLYVIRDGRMAAVDIEILDRLGSDVIVSADLAEDERVITTRLSQAGEGVAVMVEGEPVETAGSPGEGPSQGGRPGGQGG